MKPKLVFVHGWGFHGGVWEQIAPHFDGYDVSHWGGDFISGGPELSRDICEGAIVVAYSFGVAQVLAARPPRMRALVSVCGFDSLVHRGREAPVRDILAGLERNPFAQMRAFWANCGVAGFARRDDLNTVELVAGLEDMLRLDAREALVGVSCPVLALASLDDPVVPYDLSKQVWERFGLITSSGGGHGLPVSRAKWCVDEIQRFLEKHVA